MGMDQNHSDHIEYLGYGGYGCGCANEKLREIVGRYGVWLEGLATGALEPMTDAQRRFVQVAKGLESATTEFELAWLAYTDEQRQHEQFQAEQMEYGRLWAKELNAIHGEPPEPEPDPDDAMADEEYLRSLEPGYADQFGMPLSQYGEPAEDWGEALDHAEGVAASHDEGWFYAEDDTEDDSTTGLGNEECDDEDKDNDEAGE